MGRFKTTLKACKFLHQKEYDTDFEVCVCRRSGFFDFPPFSFFYGVSDIGSWDCIVSCNENKIFITKSSYLNLEEVKKEFSLQRDQLESCKIGLFKIRIVFKNYIPELGKNFNFRIIEEFDKDQKFEKQLKILFDH